MPCSCAEKDHTSDLASGVTLNGMIMRRAKTQKTATPARCGG